MYKRIIIVLAAVLALSSCRKDELDIVNPDFRYCYSYESQFETIWQGIDNGYVFWAREKVDWDSVHEAMLPVFRAFDAKGGATDAELTEAYGKMVEGLIDHHMYIQVKNIKTGNAVYADPAWSEVPSRDYYHPNYFNAQVALLPSMTGVTQYTEGVDAFPCYFALFPGTNGKKIAYFRFRSFSLSDLNYMVQTMQISPTALAPVVAFYGGYGMNGVEGAWAGSPQVEAVIIDVRGNNGGNLGDFYPMICSLTPYRTDYGYSRVKEGLGRLDYSAWVPFSLNSYPNHIGADKKVVVLADCNSASCAELTARFAQLFPHGTFIGERTYGATCPLLPGGHDLLYSGVFGDYNRYGYYCYTSNFDVVTSDYQSLEGIGVTPDIECLFDLSALQSGHDNQLERALQFIRTGK